jgi:hypothetical protein
MANGCGASPAALTHLDGNRYPSQVPRSRFGYEGWTSVPLRTYMGLLTNGNQVTITDTNPIPPQEFYRIGISLP